MTSGDPWDGPSCPTCQGKGERVYLGGRTWISVQCHDCHGTGLANSPTPVHYRDDGTRIPDDGEEYDEAKHGKPGPAYALSDELGCRTCFGAGIVLNSTTLREQPCPACRGLRRGGS